MGGGFSQLFPCFNPAVNRGEPEVIFTATEPLDETLGHSFCYVRSSARFVSPTHSDRFVSPSQSLRFDSDPVPKPRPPGSGLPETTAFRAISGASVSANTSTPRTVLQLDGIYDDDAAAAANEIGGGANSNGAGGSSLGFSSGVKGSIVNGFESSSLFSALPLQPVPRGEAATGESSGQMERTFFMSGPIERGALSGPLDAAAGSDGGGGVPFSAPLGGMYVKKKRKKSISGFRKAFYRNFPEKKRPWVVPVRNFVGGRKDSVPSGYSGETEIPSESNVQWALGKAGEDRVQVVISEELGWLFIGIYDGFNGPDAPEFLMSNLYKAMYKELEGLFWVNEETCSSSQEVNAIAENVVDLESNIPSNLDKPVEESTSREEVTEIEEENESNRGSVKKVTFQSQEIQVRRRRLWEFLQEAEAEDGLDLSGSDRFAFSVDDAISVSTAGTAVSRRSLLLSKLKHGLAIKHKENRSLFPWKFGLAGKETEEVEVEESRVPEQTSNRSGKMRKVGPVDHDMVLSAMSRALEVTELAYLNMTDRVLDRYPELALMGSCLLVALMRDEDVYVMNVGDSRAIVAQYEPVEGCSSAEINASSDSGSNVHGVIVEELADATEKGTKVADEAPFQPMKLSALQLSTDHSTSIEEEIIRIKNEHPDDSNCIVNDRVKGRLKVTRAFGAGFLKQPKLNDALLEMFRNDYIGTAPYISCSPSLRHHKLCPRDQFLVLSSDGLYQYLSNQEVVSFVENFMEKFPDGDPAQHLIEELLLRAARKAGMDFHELLDIPQGDRRKYHDDVTVMIISLEGRIWKSSGKYP
ncbi:OLC1v1031379C1 [Oldenlandia corymbosa var. corymbosa]|uniref:OLC1v1031379C1 n=1 Tax=Oldenlandia corymbosa var. corymbosa TaxID=529605 RepID=A0AAV1CLI7_OLDCO|nr:OLC1v1031379C1 [Oldenlandia corymbosa var. corymbosa]